jgi:trehalose 6-phosphate phosphatase
VSAPVHLFEVWAKVARALRAPARKALCIDFDGTLAPIRRRPDDARISRKTRGALRAIREEGTLVAVISGRQLSELEEKTAVPGIWFAGAHGFYLRSPGNRLFALLNPTEQARVKRAFRFLRPRLRGIPGVRMERKRATIAVHYRGASRPAMESARKVLSALQIREPRISLLPGKKVWEVMPSSRVDKWAAIRLMLRQEQFPITQGGGSLFYLGDDVTDERVFRNLGDFSVVVGRKRRTAARYYLRSPAEVGRFLERWIEEVR